jgi:hypothetical protein
MTDGELDCNEVRFDEVRVDKKGKNDKEGTGRASLYLELFGITTANCCPLGIAN